MQHSTKAGRSTRRRVRPAAGAKARKATAKKAVARRGLKAREGGPKHGLGTKVKPRRRVRRTGGPKHGLGTKLKPRPTARRTGGPKHGLGTKLKPRPTARRTGGPKHGLETKLKPQPTARRAGGPKASDTLGVGAPEAGVLTHSWPAEFERKSAPRDLGEIETRSLDEKTGGSGDPEVASPKSDLTLSLRVARAAGGLRAR